MQGRAGMTTLSLCSLPNSHSRIPFYRRCPLKKSMNEWKEKIGDSRYHCKCNQRWTQLMSRKSMIAIERVRLAIFIVRLAIGITGHFHRIFRRDSPFTFERRSHDVLRVKLSTFLPLCFKVPFLQVASPPCLSWISALPYVPMSGSHSVPKKDLRKNHNHNSRRSTSTRAPTQPPCNYCFVLHIFKYRISFNISFLCGTRSHLRGEVTYIFSRSSLFFWAE